MKLNTIAVFCLLAVSAFFGCDSGNTPQDASGDNGVFDDSADHEPSDVGFEVDDAAADANDDGSDGAVVDSVTGDSIADSGGQVELLEVPYVTPPCDSPVPDREFVQEINHTGIEIGRLITDVRDVVIRPSWASEWFDDVTVIGAAGIVRDSVRVEGITPDGAPQAPLGAAFGAEELFVVYPSGLVRYSQHGVETALTMPSPDVFSGVFRSGGITFAASTDALYLFDSNGFRPVAGIAGGPNLVAAVSADGTRLYVSGESGSDQVSVKPFDAGRAEAGSSTAQFRSPVGRVRGIVTDVTIPADFAFVLVGETGIAGFDASGNRIENDAFAAARLPLDPATATDAARTSDGGFVVAAPGGAFRIMIRDEKPEWRLYNSFRWVADDLVYRVATTPEVPDSPLYFASAGGMTGVTVERTSIERKLDAFVDRIVARHDRDGAVADSRLTVPGDLSTNIPWDSDNDGGWTSYWVLGECFRYRVTGDPDAKSHFDRSLQAMLNLRLLTGTDWFLARALIRKDGCRLDDCDDPDDGEWFTSPDGEWWVKSDTSNDEVTSHMFMMAQAYDLCADEEQKQAIAEHVSAIVGGIIDHGFQLWKPTGECTTYGAFDPFYVNSIGMMGDGGQLSAQLLAAITLAWYMTGESRFMDAKNLLISEHHYDENVVHSTEPPGRRGNGDGDELSTQAFIVLMRYETDPALHSRWVEGWRKLYENTRRQQAALWDVINGVVGGDSPDFAMTARWLRLYPVDLIRWGIHNSHRRDLVPAPEYYMTNCTDCRVRSDGFIIPPDERPNDRFNTNQFKTDGGLGGGYEMDGAEVLAAYWMARYYGFIVPEQR